jgi:hypothetical protein
MALQKDRHNISISTFNGGDSVSERVFEEKRHRSQKRKGPFANSQVQSTNFDSTTRYNTNDHSARINTNTSSHQRGSLHSIDYSTIGLKTRKNVHILVSANQQVRTKDLISPHRMESDVPEELPELQISRQILKTRT